MGKKFCAKFPRFFALDKQALLDGYESSKNYQKLPRFFALDKQALLNGYDLSDFDPENPHDHVVTEGPASRRS